jgi:fructokinase
MSAHPQLTLTGIGEILMDRFDSGAVTLGGAPFNLTFHLHQVLSALHLGNATFVSAVGRDSAGDDIRAQVTAADMSLEYLATDPTHPTGAARVFETPGEAGFEILQDVAWDYLQPSEALTALAASSQGVVFGSLAQRSDLSRATIQSFVANVSGPRLYDVNLRRNTTDGVAGYSAEIVAASLELATVVKMNDTELQQVATMLGVTVPAQDPDQRLWALMARFLEQYHLDAITVTRGAQGALLLDAAHTHYQLPDSTLPADRVHPVGAGDSFAAGLLCGIVQHWSFEHSLALADIMSSFVVLDDTATPALTTAIIARIQALAAQAAPAGATA